MTDLVASILRGQFILTQTPRELDDEAILVFAGVIDEDLRCAHSPFSNSALLNFSTLQFSLTVR